MSDCTSLTTPGDSDKKWESDHTEITNEELKIAVNKLSNTDFTEKFPQRERAFADEEINSQKVGLFSFIPAKGATPNKNGVYGFAKLRGNFQTEQEASDRAEKIIKETDSTHTIFHTWVGKPFPVTIDEKYVQDVEEVNIRKEQAVAISKSIKDQNKKDKKIVDEIQERQRVLKEDVKRTKKSDYEDDEDEEFLIDDYITLKVKKAQLHWTYMQHIEKILDLRKLILNVNVEVEQKDSENPEMKAQFYAKYMKAREQSGFTSLTEEEMKNSFMQYLVEDAYLPGINVEDKFTDAIKEELNKRLNGTSYTTK